MGREKTLLSSTEPRPAGAFLSCLWSRLKKETGREKEERAVLIV